MIFCYKFNFQRIKCKSLLSKIEQVEMLIALGRGDKYRLAHIRETLEIGKELYISDKDFLEDLVKTHLKDKIYQARIVSISEKPNLFCEECGSEISADEKFCTNCGTDKSRNQAYLQPRMYLNPFQNLRRSQRLDQIESTGIWRLCLY